MANIKDVARHACVSVATVSRVINNKGYVNEHTKQLVLDSIAELNYVPNEIARALYRKSSRIIGIIVTDLSNEFFNHMLAGLEEVILQHGYKTMLCTSHEKIEREHEYIQMFSTYKIDGLILCSNSPDIQAFLNLDIPIVTLDRIISAKIPSITADNYQGGILAAKRLLQANCKNIVQFRGPTTLTPSNERATAFLETLSTEASVRVHTVELNFHHTDEQDIYKFLITHPQIDGIFAGSDIIAAQCMRALKKLSRDVPKDVQIIGYDNISICEITNPTITTIAQPILSMGQIAAETLFKLINNEEIENRHLSLPVELIERESTQ